MGLSCPHCHAKVNTSYDRVYISFVWWCPVCYQAGLLVDLLRLHRNFTPAETVLHLSGTLELCHDKLLRQYNTYYTQRQALEEYESGTNLTHTLSDCAVLLSQLGITLPPLHATFESVARLSLRPELETAYHPNQTGKYNTSGNRVFKGIKWPVVLALGHYVTPGQLIGHTLFGINPSTHALESRFHRNYWYKASKAKPFYETGWYAPRELFFQSLTQPVLWADVHHVAAMQIEWFAQQQSYLPLFGWHHITHHRGQGSTQDWAFFEDKQPVIANPSHDPRTYKTAYRKNYPVSTVKVPDSPTEYNSWIHACQVQSENPLQAIQSYLMDKTNDFMEQFFRDGGFSDYEISTIVRGFQSHPVELFESKTTYLYTDTQYAPAYKSRDKWYTEYDDHKICLLDMDVEVMSFVDTPRAPLTAHVKLTAGEQSKTVAVPWQEFVEHAVPMLTELSIKYLHKIPKVAPGWGSYIPPAALRFSNPKYLIGRTHFGYSAVESTIRLPRVDLNGEVVPSKKSYAYDAPARCYSKKEFTSEDLQMLRQHPQWMPALFEHLIYLRDLVMLERCVELDPNTASQFATLFGLPEFTLPADGTKCLAYAREHTWPCVIYPGIHTKDWDLIQSQFPTTYVIAKKNAEVSDLNLPAQLRKTVRRLVTHLLNLALTVERTDWRQDLRDLLQIARDPV